MTLVLDHDGGLATLAEALQGRWPIIFSNPEHFAPPQAQLLEEAGVLPVTLAEHPSWCARVALRRWPDDALPPAVRHLIDAIRSVDDAYVIVADDRLQLRQAQSYFSRSKAPTLGSVISAVDRLRGLALRTAAVRDISFA